jgi:hypothetical protein
MSFVGGFQLLCSNRARFFGITVTVLDCTPQVRQDNLGDRHSEDDLWQDEERSVSFRRRTN